MPVHTSQIALTFDADKQSTQKYLLHQYSKAVSVKICIRKITAETGTWLPISIRRAFKHPTSPSISPSLLLALPNATNHPSRERLFTSYNLQQGTNTQEN